MEFRRVLFRSTGGDEAAARAVLQAFGEPDEIARLYRAERIVGRLETSRSPWTVALVAWRTATLSLEAFLVFLGSFTLYALSLSFLATAAMKPFWPDKVGFWVAPDTVSIGMTSHPVGPELLGWRIIPVGLVIGLIVGWLA